MACLFGLSPIRALYLIPVLVILVFHKYKRRGPVFGLCIRGLWWILAFGNNSEVWIKKSQPNISEENPQISLIFLRQSIGYYSAALRKTKNRILTIRKWGMYLVYNKRLKKSKKENNRYIFFLSLYYKRESLCTNICQLWVLILLVMRTMQNWYCNYRSESFTIENPCKNVAS